jgi:DNA repair protein RecO (recombination protein O)
LTIGSLTIDDFSAPRRQTQQSSISPVRSLRPHTSLAPLFGCGSPRCVTLKYPLVPDMPARVSEAIILRTYPFQEADLVVSFLTRDLGKLRGVARRARRMKSRFGAGLERLSRVGMFYFQRETRELVSLDSCELISSQFALASDYTIGVALDYIAEVSEQLLPPAEPNERFFRLLIAVLEYLRERQERGVWQAVSYFSLWAVKLSGFLPELRVSRESREIAGEILHTPIGQLADREWTKETAADLRRFLVRTIEEQIEHRLITAPMLEAT